MIYRPQFAYSTPAGCRDVDFTYFFDASNTELLNQNISGLTLSYIPLTLEQDAPFLWRGWKINADRKLTGTVPTSYAIPNYGVRFEDWNYNKLSDDFVDSILSGFPSNPWAINSAQLTGPPVPIPEIFCPPGSVLWAFLKAPTFVDGLNHFASFSLHGVKRFKEC